MHNHNQVPQLLKGKPKAPSAATTAAEQITGYISRWASKWEVEAVSRGSTDAAAHQQAAKSLLHLLQHLAHHKGTCKRGEVR